MQCYDDYWLQNKKNIFCHFSLPHPLPISKGKICWFPIEKNPQRILNDNYTRSLDLRWQDFLIDGGIPIRRGVPLERVRQAVACMALPISCLDNDIHASWNCLLPESERWNSETPRKGQFWGGQFWVILSSWLPIPVIAFFSCVVGNSEGNHWRLGGWCWWWGEVCFVSQLCQGFA